VFNLQKIVSEDHDQDSYSAGPVEFGDAQQHVDDAKFLQNHIRDPITFDSSIVITWQIGDTSQVPWTSGTPKIAVTVYYYTEM
jgi:hypothetical protein